VAVLFKGKPIEMTTYELADFTPNKIPTVELCSGILKGDKK
jgi:hypothetical protein